MQAKRTHLSYDDYANGIQTLSPEEQLKLLELISAGLRKTLKTRKAKHSIMELEGLGAEMPESRGKAIKMLEKLRKTAAVGDVLSPIGERLAKLKQRKLINGDPDDLVNVKVGEWSEADNL